MPLTTRRDLLNDFKQTPNKDVSFFAGQSRHRKWIIHNDILDPDYKIQSSTFADLYFSHEKITDKEAQLDSIAKLSNLIDTIVTIAEILVIIHKSALGTTEKASRCEKELIIAKEKQEEIRLLKITIENIPLPPAEVLASAQIPPQAHPLIQPASDPIIGAQSKKDKTKLEMLWSPVVDAWLAIKHFIEAYFKNLKVKVEKMFVQSSVFKEVVFFWNWLRLCLIRVKKLLNTLIPFLNKEPKFLQLVANVNKYTDNVFPYLGWIFFIPRFGADSILLVKGSLRNFLKDKAEPDLDSSILFLAHLLRRWSRMFNDLIWMIAGIINCFYLGAMLPTIVFMSIAFPASIFITAALYFYDVLLSGIVALIDLFRLNKLQEAYTSLVNSALNEYNSYENKRIAWNLSVVTITCVGAVVCFILPSIIPGAIVPLAGAFLLLCMSFVFRYARDYIIPPPPITKVTGLASFFKSKVERAEVVQSIAAVTSSIIPASG